jgi:hypothetical protein
VTQSQSRHASLNEPTLPGRRRIVTLREEEYDRASYEAPELLEDAETWVINYDAAMGGTLLGPVLQRLVRARLLRPTQVLLLSPYEDAYVAAMDAEEEFSLRKFEIFTTLCYLLGAKQVVASRDDLDEASRHEGGKVAVGRAGVKVEGTLNRDLRERVEQKLSVTSTFEPSDPDTHAAEELLARHGLLEDSTMRGLLELFMIDGSRVKSRELVLNVTSEASREIAGMASLKIPTALSVSASFSSVNKAVQELLVRLKVTFK